MTYIRQVNFSVRSYAGYAIFNPLISFKLINMTNIFFYKNENKKNNSILHDFDN